MMDEAGSAQILVIGAGAMGIVTGYRLAAGGSRVTFLVRPRRMAELARPQLLYSYDDNSLRTFDKYEVISAASEIERGKFDYIVFTIDGMALRSDEGQDLVRQIGAAARGTRTKVLIGTIGINLRPDFLRASGLDEDQVFNGGLYTAVYQIDRVTLPVHPPTDPDLRAKADFGFRQASPIGMFVDSSAPAAAAGFKELWEAAGTSLCAILSPETYAAQVAGIFPMFAACDYMDWVSWKDLQTDRPLWDLTAAATREIQGLGINGDEGRRAQSETSADSLLDLWRGLEKETLPLDLCEFNRFHHGGKVFAQDIELLEDCVKIGEAEGKTMSSLKELIAKVVGRHAP